MVYVGFSTPRAWNPISAAIRKATGSETSHAWMLVRDPHFKANLVMEAHSTGFRLLSFPRFLVSNRIVAIVRPAHPLSDGLPTAARFLGERFDYLGLVRLGLAILKRWWSTEKTQPFPTTSALFCSEAVVRTMHAADFPGSLQELRPENVTPQELLDWLCKEARATRVWRKEIPPYLVRLKEDLRSLRHARRLRARTLRAGAPQATSQGSPLPS